MFGGQGGGGRPIQRIIAVFREKGATSPDKAMTAQELGLPPRFEEAMHRRLGATGIFVEVNGKYYLDEAKLKQVQEQRRAMGGAGARSMGSVFATRIARMLIGPAAVVLAILNILVLRSYSVTLVVVGLLVIWLVLTVYQISYLARMRRRWATAGMGTNASTAKGAL